MSNNGNTHWFPPGGGGDGVIHVTPPTVSVGTYTYNGSAQGPTITHAEGMAGYYTITNATKTDAGTYTLTIALKNTNKCVWHENNVDSTADKTYTYTINKATPTLTLSKSSVSLDSNTLSDTVTIAKTGDGTLSIASDNTSAATASLSETTATISSVNSTTGTATVTVTLSETTNYAQVTETISVTATFTTVYGISWNGGSGTAWSRTDAAANFTDPVPAVNNGNGSSPFDSCMPWSGMKRVNDSDAGVLVEIPKYYYKWTRSGATMKLQIADGPMDGFHVSPAHADRGDGAGERDVVYVGAYHCSTSDYKSTSGVKPKGSVTRPNFRTSIHNLGSKIWQYDYAMYWTIAMLYLVEFADWNSQAKIGYGCGNNSATENSGSTDAMTYHTGTNKSNRTTYGHTRYRYIEDLWGNVFDWVDGIYFSGSDVYCIKNPASFSDSSGGTKVGTRATSDGFISGWTNPTASGFEYALYPNAVSGSESTYVCDGCWQGGTVLCAGGYYSQAQYCGLFYLDGDSSASDSYGSIGSRLQKLP